jgi:glycerophosphoryl diester phosphodiesterase
MKRLLHQLIAALALPTAVYSSTKIEPEPKSQFLNNPYERLGEKTKFDCKEFGIGQDYFSHNGSGNDVRDELCKLYRYELRDKYSDQKFKKKYKFINQAVSKKRNNSKVFKNCLGQNQKNLIEKNNIKIYAHRGASQQLPEHTLEAYSLALEQGADRIEIDLISTKDGVLIARHDLTLDSSTNVKDIFETNRISTKIVNGKNVKGYFASDFTFSEIRMLKGRQTKKYRDQSFNDKFEIPSFNEILNLIINFNEKNNKSVGLFAELKNPNFHNNLGLEVEKFLVTSIYKNKSIIDFKIDIQSFELEALLRFNKLLKKKNLNGIDTSLITYRVGDISKNNKKKGSPYDFKFNLQKNNDLEKIYGLPLINSLGPNISFVSYKDLLNNKSLKALKSSGIDGIVYWNRDLIKREKLIRPFDLNKDGKAKVKYKFTGEISTIITDAKSAALDLAIFTIRDEEKFQSLGFNNEINLPAYEVALLNKLGVKAVILDNTLTGVNSKKLFIPETFIIGSASDDNLQGSCENEYISAGNGNDIVNGQDGDDKIFGGNGKDKIWGGLGRDILYGGLGQDIFYYSFGDNYDVIRDFENNVDKISFDNVSLKKNQSILDFVSQEGNDVVFNFGKGNILKINNSTIRQLQDDIKLD